MAIPEQPKIYHIVHVDRLPSIINDQHLWCDSEIVKRAPPGTTIGMNSIKQRRLKELQLTSYPGLYVGNCVPFYFCPRSVMLFMISKKNDPDLGYRDGQDSIIHLEADLYTSVKWAENTNRRWVFTLSNAGTSYFEDRNDLEQLNEINWAAVQATQWSSGNKKDGKQAEFLMEHCFPWRLIERIGANSKNIYKKVENALCGAEYQPRIEVIKKWYY